MIRLCSHGSLKPTKRCTSHHIGSIYGGVTVLANCSLSAPVDLMISCGIFHEPIFYAPFVSHSTPSHVVYVRAVLICASLLAL